MSWPSNSPVCFSLVKVPPCGQIYISSHFQISLWSNKCVLTMSRLPRLYYYFFLTELLCLESLYKRQKWGRYLFVLYGKAMLGKQQPPVKHLSTRQQLKVKQPPQRRLLTRISQKLNFTKKKNSYVEPEGSVLYSANDL